MVSPVCLETGDISLSFAPFYSSGNWTQRVNELKHTEQKEQGQVGQPWSPQRVRGAGLGCHSEEFKLGAVTSGEIAV